MALPSTGEISFNLFNTDRNIASGTQVDMDTAAIAYGIPTKPHGMDEFLGRGTGTPPTPAPPTPAPPTPAPPTPAPPTPAPPTPAPPTPAPPTPPPPTPAPQVYTYLSQCGTGGVAQGHIFGSYNYGTNIYDDVNEICYIAVGTSYTPTDTHLFRATGINGCTCPTPPPPTPPPPTPPPAVTATVTQDCSGTTGASGRIFIENIANGGSDCYVGYSVDTASPAALATLSIGSATSYTFTGVGDYGGSYGVYIYNATTGAGVRYGISAVACYVAPPTPPPPTPAPPTYYSFNFGYNAGDDSLACAMGVTTEVWSTCSSLIAQCVLKSASDGSSNAADGYYSNGTSVYYVEGNGFINTVSSCPAPPPPPPTPTPPPPPPPEEDPCFLYGTEIKMADGSNKLIEDLVLGDILSSLSIEGLDKDIEKNWVNFSDTKFWFEPSTARVVTLMHGSYSNYYIINKSIRITYEHPVFIKRGNEYKFCKVYNLLVGDYLFNTNDIWVRIRDIEFINETCQTVSVNIEDDDVYFGSGILVHNRAEVKQIE